MRVAISTSRVAREARRTCEEFVLVGGDSLVLPTLAWWIG